MSIDLYHGNCLEVMKQLPDASVDCFICDLPYGCLIGGGGQEKKKRQLVRYVDGEETKNTAVYNGGVMAGCSWDIKIPLDKLWEQIKRLCKNDHTPVIMFCTTKFGYELIKSNESWFRYDLVWDKQRGVSFLSANKMPMRSHEMIYVFSKAGAHYIRKDIEGDYKGWKQDINQFVKSNTYNKGKNNIKKTVEIGGDNKRCALSVIKANTKTVKGNHPTEKPIDLYKWLIERYCPLNGTLLDPTAGSFNSCWAGYELDRHCIGIEKDNEFYKKASEKADRL